LALRRWLLDWHLTLVLQANTPRRIRSYLGGLFTGCLMVVPQQDIVLVS